VRHENDLLDSSVSVSIFHVHRWFCQHHSHLSLLRDAHVAFIHKKSSHMKPDFRLLVVSIFNHEEIMKFGRVGGRVSVCHVFFLTVTYQIGRRKIPGWLAEDLMARSLCLWTGLCVSMKENTFDEREPIPDSPAVNQAPLLLLIRQHHWSISCRSQHITKSCTCTWPGVLTPP
jgi:hypothetical protein